MTKMANKSVDARRHRRTRFKRALKPIMEMFGCTQMECADRIRNVLRDNASMADELTKLQEAHKQRGEEIADLKSQLNEKKS